MKRGQGALEFLLLFVGVFVIGLVALAVPGVGWVLGPILMIAAVVGFLLTIGLALAFWWFHGLLGLGIAGFTVVLAAYIAYVVLEKYRKGEKFEWWKMALGTATPVVLLLIAWTQFQTINLPFMAISRPAALESPLSVAFSSDITLSGPWAIFGFGMIISASLALLAYVGYASENEYIKGFREWLGIHQ